MFVLQLLVAINTGAKKREKNRGLGEAVDVDCELGVLPLMCDRSTDGDDLTVTGNQRHTMVVASMARNQREKERRNMKPAEKKSEEISH